MQTLRVGSAVMSHMMSLVFKCKHNADSRGARPTFPHFSVFEHWRYSCRWHGFRCPVNGLPWHYVTSRQHMTSALRIKAVSAPWKACQEMDKRTFLLFKIHPKYLHKRFVQKLRLGATVLQRFTMARSGITRFTQRIEGIYPEKMLGKWRHILFGRIYIFFYFANFTREKLIIPTLSIWPFRSYQEATGHLKIDSCLPDLTQWSLRR